MVCRLCAVGGDTVEIKNGVLFVNGVDADKNLVLAHHYRIAPDDWLKYNTIHPEDSDLYQTDNPSDSFLVPLIDKIVEAHNIPAKLVLYPADSVTNLMNTEISHNRNPDNAGPFIMPPHTYFVLGDNRLESEDSRYLGFIPEKDFIATVIGK